MSLDNKTLQSKQTQKENDCKLIADSYKASEYLQAIKQKELQNTIKNLENTLNLQRRSLSWQLTFPLRMVEFFFKKEFYNHKIYKDYFKRAYEIYNQDGWKVLIKKVYEQFAKYIGLNKKRIIGIRNKSLYSDPLSADRLSRLAPHILIIAELSLIQCAKYRVWQRKEQLESLGWVVSVVDWCSKESALEKLQVCTKVIFYRTPAFNIVKHLIKEARRLGLSPYWEVDDLIFSEEYFLKNKNIVLLNKKEKSQALWGVQLFKECLLLCDQGIASTPKLAQIMHEMGMKNVFILENALDKNTLSLITKIQNTNFVRDHGSEEIRIFYGSGTNTHNADFQVAAQGIAAVMLADSRLTLYIAGELTIPECCNVVRYRIKHISHCDYETYMHHLSQADITLAPLENSFFNDCKSNIKFIEGAVFSIPVICSPSDAYANSVENGKNGIIAYTKGDWEKAILDLANNKKKRLEIGEKAKRYIYENYSPNAVITDQVLPIFGFPPVKNNKIFSILSVNVYFSPNSFGGATFVAQEMAKYLGKQKNVRVSVFTSRPAGVGEALTPLRYQVEACDVLAVEEEPESQKAEWVSLDNPRITENFRDWLQATQPDCVHFHALAGLGVGLTRVCMEEGIPYVITLHDAWWLCDRHYMVNNKGYFCGQKKIDISICKSCVLDAPYLDERFRLMQIALQHAALLLVPSEAHKRLYLDNGVDPQKIVLNKNGFVWPKKRKTRPKPNQPLRFGYVSGSEAVKGFNILRKVFEKITDKNWELLIVENKESLGIKSIQVSGWKTQGVVKTIPAYTQNTMDDFYNSIDILLFPSQCKESYGLAVYEALARDVWVVTTNGGGQSEGVVDGENGTVIAADGQPHALEKAVKDSLKKRDFFINYKNKYKEKLTTFEQQGSELYGLLKHLVKQAKGDYSSSVPGDKKGKCLSSCERVE